MTAPTEVAPSWAAVVVNYEAGASLTTCVETLLADDSAGAPEVVVVDNGSADGSVDQLEATFPQVTVIRPGANLGYGRAANLGAAATRAPIVAVLNPDTEVEAGTAAALVRPVRGGRPARGGWPAATQFRRVGVPVRTIGSVTARRDRACAPRRRRAEQPVHALVPPARCRSGGRSAGRMDLRRGGLAPARRTRSGRRLGRAVLPVLRRRGPLPAARGATDGRSPTSPAAT